MTGLGTIDISNKEGETRFKEELIEQPWMNIPKLCLPFIAGTFVALVSLLTKANVQAIATLWESDNLSEPFFYISFILAIVGTVALT